MRRVLMIAYYFPPLGGIGSLRAAKFATYLPEFGWEPTVVAPRDGAYYRDSSLVVAEERVLRTNSMELSRWGKRVVGLRSSDTKMAPVGPIRGRLRDFVRRWMYFPDAQVGWYPFAVSAARKALREAQYETIFSSSFPITSHLVARRLSRDFDVPWVAEFRDPWTERLAPDLPRRAAAVRLEKELVGSAAAVVVPSQRWGHLFSAKGARHVAVITNGFDAEDVSPAVPVEPFVVSYLGSLYPEQQDLSAVWAVLARLRRSGDLPSLSIRFIGDLPQAVRSSLSTEGLEDNIEVTGFLPHPQALAHLARSSLLLLAGPRKADDIDKGWIVAKVFEYLATGLPVLYTGDPSTEVAEVLSTQPGCYIVPHEQPALLERAVRESQRHSSVTRELTAFTRRRLAESLASTLVRAST